MAFDYITSGPPIIPAPTQPSLLFDKTNDVVYVSTMPSLMNAPAWVAVGGSGGLSVNGVLVGSPDLDNSSPAPPGGKTNITWQTNGSQISGWVPSAAPAGSTKQIQFNNAGAFGASSELLWDIDNTISALHTLNIGNSTSAAQTNCRVLVNDQFTTDIVGSYGGIYSVQSFNLTGDQSAKQFASMATTTSFFGDATYGGIFSFDLNTLYAGTGPSTAVYGFYAAMNVNPGSPTSALIPFYAGAANAGDCAQINGLFSGVQHSTGTAVEAAGVRISLDISGNVTALYGVKIDTLGLSTGVVSSYKGIYVGDVTTIGAGTNTVPWSIYTDGGNSFFKDSVYVGPTQTTATTPVNRTRITGGTGYSAISSIEMNGQGIIAIREVSTHSFLDSTTDFSGLNTAAIQISRVWNPATPLVNMVLTSVDSAIGNDAVYHGTITGGGSNAYAGATIIVFGFSNSANNGIFRCDASTSTTLTLVNVSASAETHAATAFTGGESFNGITNHVLTDDSSTKTLTNATITASENQVWMQGFTTGGVYHSVDGVVYSQPSVTGTVQADEIKCFYSEVLFGGVAASTHNATLVVGFNCGTHGWLTPSVGTIGTSWAINIEGPRLPSGTTMSTRKAIRIASQAQSSGGTNTDPWGIYEENATEKNALGKINIGGASGPLISSGTGSPEGVVTAPVGSLFLRTNGGAGTTLYIKESGAGNTGWVGK